MMSIRSISALQIATRTRLRILTYPARLFHDCSSKCKDWSGGQPDNKQPGKDDQSPSPSDSTKTSASIIEQTAMLTDPSLTDVEKLATLTTELKSRTICSEDVLKLHTRAETAEMELIDLREANEQLSRDNEYYR